MKKVQKSVKLRLIGQKINIIHSANESIIGLSGKIIDETKNTLKLRTLDKDKIIQKKQSLFKINDALIEGDKTIGRIEERIKKYFW